VIVRHHDAILHGDPSGPEEDAVVFVIAKASRLTARCSGTLVAPNLVITARHCVSEYAANTFTCTPEGELAPGSVGGTMGALIPAENVEIAVGADPGTNPEIMAVGQRIFSVETTTICRSDIAMVLLDRDIPNLPIAPMRLGRGNSVGELIRVVGYGLDENQDFGKRNTRSGVRIEGVGESEFLDEGDAVPRRTFLTLGPTLCIGDSGGPAFTENAAITAVWSSVVGECTANSARNYFTQIAPFENTIVRPAFEAAGYEPLLEDGPVSGSGGAPSAGGAPSMEGGAGGEPAAAGGAEAGVGGAPPQGTGGSAEAGTPGDDAGAGGEPGAPEPPAYRGPRKSGGLKCELSPGGRQNWHASLLSLVIGMMLVARRARANYRGS
jgi:hypothetical protein